MLQWLRRMRKRVLRWWRPKPQRISPPSPPKEPTPVKLAEPAPVVTEISSNRRERRALERARRKYDKFVKPQGVAIEKPKRETQQVKPRQKRVEVIVADEAVDDAEITIADSHHENRDDVVLYKEAELYGEFNFRDTILQQLERYFVYIERMKKADPDAYGFYREVGATILPYLASGSWKRGDKEDDEKSKKHVTPLPGYFHKTRPSFGCFVYGADPETERYEREGDPGRKGKFWVPKFMYFRKYKKPPPELQLIAGGDIYAMTVYWDAPFDKRIKYGRPQEFGIFISADGKEVIALKACNTKYIPVPSKRETRSSYRTGHYTRGPIPRRRDLGHIVVPQRAYHIPGEFEKWAKDHGEDCQHFLTELFKTSIVRSEQSRYSMTRVTATKGDIAAVFGVNIHRTAYFFQDRDVTLTEHGERKRIFHFVRPHVRSNGEEVRAHFRGLREFSWAGYEIRITVPGRDHVDIADVNFGAEDAYWEEEGVKYVSMSQLGKDLKALMRRQKGASK